MHVQRIQSKQRGTVYQQILLRESYREPGEHRSKVKKRTLLNLTKYPENVVKAIELALKHRHNLPELERLLSGSFLTSKVLPSAPYGFCRASAKIPV
jgi:hypothetical protein